jgi:hypothetical protein
MIPEPGIQERTQLGQRWHAYGRFSHRHLSAGFGVHHPTRDRGRCSIRQFAADALVTILVPGTQQPYGLAMEGVPSVMDGGALDLMGIM